MMKLERGRGFALVSLWLGGALLAGCPVAPGDDDGNDTGGEDAEETADDAPDDGMTSNPTTGMGQTGSEDDTGPDPDTGETDAATDTTGDTGETDDGTDTGTTGGEEACQIMLPPPGECTMGAPEEPPPFAVLAGEWSAKGQWKPPGSVVVDDDPAAGGFIDPPDGGGGTPVECDSYLQDCPDGEKCMPWANDGGGSWNALRCSPIAPAPNQIGDDCTVEGSGVSGIDDCDLGQMCWDVDPETNMGVCIELCTCTPASPICNTANTACVITNGGVLNLCLDVCNPLDPGACSDGQGCYPAGDLFHCAPDVSGGSGQGDECAFLNSCPAGMACLGAAAVPGCSGAGCCSSFCDADADCPDGLSCLDWYVEGEAPDDCLGMTGVCAAPA